MTAKIPEQILSKPTNIGNGQIMPKPYKIRRYYLPSDISNHGVYNDCWLVIFGEVYDITPLLQLSNNKLCEPLIKAAGTDISHWFDSVTKDPKVWVDPKLNISTYYTPQGRFLHVPPPVPDSSWVKDYDMPWWRDRKYVIGKITCKVRKIRIFNMLTKHENIIEVCTEDKLNEILDRFLDVNQHAASYTWKRLGKPLDMDKTLSDNSIPDETQEMINLGIDEDDYIPAIHLYFNDDLTVA